jgi:hypothetical protein
MLVKKFIVLIEKNKEIKLAHDAGPKNPSQKSLWKNLHSKKSAYSEEGNPP